MNGIDVSHWNGAIDWVKAKTKVDFAFIKCSERLVVDDQFVRNWSEAKRVGMRRAAYLFYRFNIDPGIQTRVFLQAFNGDYGEIAPIVDLEDDGIVAALKPAQVADLQWCLLLIEKFIGKKPIIYTRKYWFDPFVGNVAWASAYQLWIANYTYNPAATPLMPLAWKTWAFYQWNNKGVGIDYGAQPGDIDLDVEFGEVVIPPPVPPSHPVATFTISTTQIVAGQSALLVWEAHGASGIYLDGQGVTGPTNNKLVKPTVNTTYTLRITYDGEPDTT